ncbi:MAG: thioredoxin family protein [Chthoniobacterales bacterium]|nr:thioredoxin family protein [Chthoniobacterales bacterium]
MASRRWLLFFLALLALCPTAARSQKFEGRQLVQASLVADVATVVPGQAFTAGLLLKMVPGWHTYWEFPGDAGIPTEIKWQLPDGWKAGPIQWPIPLKLDEPGNIQIYGYHDEVLLLMLLTPPAKIGAASVHLAAEASWLVCEKICIPGNGDMQLDLPVGAQSAPTNSALFEKFRPLIPRSLPASARDTLQWKRLPNEFQLTVADKSLAQSGAVEFFPLPDASTLIGHPRRSQSPDGSVVFAIPIESAAPGVKSLPGVLTAGDLAFSLGEQASVSAGEKASVPPDAPAGLLKLLLFGFIGGFILNLMPCVLPIISLKIFGFIQHAKDSRARIFGNGLAFTAGIFAWFIGLALLMIGLKSAGHEITWAFQFTNPYFVVVMSAVVLVFALNLFGVFEIILPAAATTGLLGWSAREGYAGSFFQGVFATVLATPCTAPYLGTALGFAFAQSALIILLMFLAIAAGMSAPYLLLSAQPAWLRFVPRPGPWMVRVKQFMGFLLLATLLFLLWVIGVARGVDAAIWVSAFLLALSIACWMYGSFLTLGTSLVRRSLVLVLMLVLVLGSGIYFIGQKFGASKIAAGQTTDGWIPFSPERVQTELAHGHSVFIDFTAAWCITCKFNEASVLESAAVKSAFERYGVVKMKADWTNADPVITKTLKQFGRVGVPLYVLYPATSPNQPIILPELLTQALVLNHLQSAAPKVAATQ